MPEWKPLPISPTGGVNSEDNEATIDDTEVAASSNFLYERNEADTRPGLNARTITGTPLSGNALDACGLYCIGSPFNLVYASDGHLYKLTASAFTQLTPVQTLQHNFLQPVSVNGAVLIGDLASGLAEWATGGTTWAAITGATPRYLTSHLSRAVGAYDNVAANGQLLVEWSKAGDETTWNTNPSTDGSGQVYLNDAPDSITGVCNLHNVIVVPRQNGFHLGFPTGVAIPAFRFEMWSKEGGGCFYPRTLAVYNNTAYMVGRDDIYSFDLTRLTPIGYKIRSQFFPFIRQDSGWAAYRGFISTAQRSGELRNRYHLAPAGRTGPHFIYDIKDGTWSIHNYSVTPGAWLNWLESSAVEGPAFADNATASPKLNGWDTTVNCETAASFTGKSLRPIGLEKDLRINRALLNTRDYNQSTAMTVSATGRIGSTSKTATDSQTISGTGSAKWIRKYFNLNEVAGSDVQLTVTVPAGVKCAIDGLVLETSESGGFRG